MDRIHPNQADEALRRVLAAPSLSQRLAERVGQYLVTAAPALPVTALSWSEALRRAHTAVLSNASPVVANAVWARFLSVLPELRLGETDGEYGLRILTAAKGL